MVSAACLFNINKIPSERKNGKICWVIQLCLPIPQALTILFRTQRTCSMKFIIRKRETKLRFKLLSKQINQMCRPHFALASCQNSWIWLVNCVRIFLLFSHVRLTNLKAVIEEQTFQYLGENSLFYDWKSSSICVLPN